VSLQINRSNYQITSTARALSNGNLGDEIDVKVLQSGVIKKAVVIGKGQVELLRQ
jgi:flagella basal body P-ring formation protein FlgA